jgi:octaprenyl-diphosphate synthase
MNPLEDHKHLFSEEISAVNDEILAIADGRPSLITSLLNHIISSGGKRLRPIYLILSSKLVNVDEKSNTSNISMAACVELLHTATLFHDDVVDGSKMRRGSKTANEMWGNSASVLVGDFLLAQAFEMMSKIGKFEIIELLSKTSSIITEGEIKQLIHKTDISTSYDDYIDIITAKTAELFSACCKVGAITQDASESDKAKLAKFGRNLGIAFQIADDAIDYISDAAKMGKTVGDDFREGKVTLPLIYLYKLADEKEKNFLDELFDADETVRDDKNLQEVLKLIEKYDVTTMAIKKAVEYSDSAKLMLEGFPDSDVKTAMLDLLEFSVNRRF